MSLRSWDMIEGNGIMDQTSNRCDEALGSNDNRSKRRPSIVGWFAAGIALYFLSPVPLYVLTHQLGVADAVNPALDAAYSPVEWCCDHVPALGTFYEWQARFIQRWLKP